MAVVANRLSKSRLLHCLNFASLGAGLEHDFSAWADAFLASVAQNMAASAVTNEKEALLGESSDDEDGSGDEIGDMEDLVGGDTKATNGGVWIFVAVLSTLDNQYPPGCAAASSVYWAGRSSVLSMSIAAH